MKFFIKHLGTQAHHHWVVLGHEYKWHNFNFKITIKFKHVLSHTKYFGLCLRWGIQFDNLCYTFELYGVTQQFGHVTTIWWFLFWACVVKQSSIWNYWWKNCSWFFKYAVMKLGQFDIQKCITWPKVFSKGQQAWNKACINFGLRPKKLNMLVKTRYNYFLSFFLLTLWVVYSIIL